MNKHQPEEHRFIAGVTVVQCQVLIGADCIVHVGQIEGFIDRPYCHVTARCPVGLHVPVPHHHHQPEHQCHYYPPVLHGTVRTHHTHIHCFNSVQPANTLPVA